MLKKQSIEITVGVFVLAFVVLVLGFFVKNYGLQDNTEHYNISAYFQRADGLVKGADVKVNGVKVGEVNSITLDPETHYASVAFNVRKNISLPTDTQAHIVSEGLMGGKYVSLQIGGEEDALKEGDKIYKTQPPIVLEDIISHMLFSAGGSEEDKESKKADDE